MDKSIELSPAQCEELIRLAKSDGAQFVRSFLELIGEEYAYSMFVEEIVANDGEPIFGFTFKEVDSIGGYEGGGEHAEIIVRIEFKGQHVSLIRLMGYYSSYEGSNWEDADIDLVEAREVMVTKYFSAAELLKEGL